MLIQETLTRFARAAAASDYDTPTERNHDE
jgi:hypothetical protein